MQKAYWKRVSTRAWAETLSAFGLTSRQRIVTKLLVALVAVALIGFFGGTSDAKSKMLAALATACAFSLVLVATYLVNVILTPAKLDNENNITVQEKRDEEEIKAAIDDLAEEISWATQNLINPTPAPFDIAGGWNFAKWHSDFDAWCNRVSAKLGNRRIFSRANQIHFDSLGVVPHIVMYNHPGFDRIMSQLNLKIERLREIINGLA